MGNEALQADYEHKQILVKELTKNLEERGEELTRYKNVLMNILEVSLIYSGTEEMDGIAFTIRDFVEQELYVDFCQEAEWLQECQNSLKRPVEERDWISKEYINNALRIKR